MFGIGVILGSAVDVAVAGRRFPLVTVVVTFLATVAMSADRALAFEKSLEGGLLRGCDQRKIVVM